MPIRKQIRPGEKVPLKLTAAERKLALEDLLCLDDDYMQILRDTPSGKPVMMTLDDLDGFGGFIAAEANHCDDKKKQKKLDAVFQKIEDLMDRYTDEEPPQIVKSEDVRKGKSESPTVKTAAGKKSKPKPAADTLFQFKITLLGIEPPIWRRIQVQNCTLDNLHEHIQTAMGWTNSHLHQFEVKDKRYGDLELLQDGFDDFGCIDSTVTMVGEIVSKTGKRFAFKYEYDFGDSWEHEILFEGCPPSEKGKKYPLCVEGERACPPEDVGGVWGYGTFLEARNDPDHEEYETYSEWGAGFDPETFDPKKATRKMKKGLPDWRSMR